MNELVSKKAVINEIKRWRGYIDDDMIARIIIGINKLPINPIFEKCPECGTVLLIRCGAYGEKVLFCPDCGYEEQMVK